jgi:hypothetical protein
MTDDGPTYAHAGATPPPAATSDAKTFAELPGGASSRLAGSITASSRRT